MKTKVFILLTTIVSVFSILPSAFGQGALTPPGAPAPTMKSLDQIEARTAISSMPYTITNGGSFYLTGNVFAGAVFGGITIQADNVTIDLNGFSLAQTNGSGNGINVQTAQKNLVIRNGTLRGWGNAVEARICTACSFTDLRILSNSIGLETGTNTFVKNCLVTGNTSDGISVLDGSMVTECTTAANGRFGLVGGNAVMVSYVCAISNANCGISITGTNGLISNCLASANRLSGIISSGRNRIIGCTSSVNGSRGIDQSLGFFGDFVEGCTVSGNIGIGINSVGHSAALLNNTVSGNGAPGISVSGDSGVIDGNVIMFNGINGLVVGAASGTNNVIIRNRAIGQAINYVISVTSKDAQRLTPGSGFVSTDPWANLSF